MAKQTINIGASPNDGTGTPLRTAFDYTNQNFTELYTATGPSGNNIVVPGSATITGDLTVATSVLKVDTANTRVGINTTSINGGPFNVKISPSIDAKFVVQDGFTTGNVRLAAVDNAYSTYKIMDFSALSYAWYNSGTTAMTLNANGLGVGVSPSYKLDVLGVSAATVASGAAFRAIRSNSGDRCLIVPLAAGSGFTIQSQNAAESDFTPIIFSGSTTTFNYRTGIGTVTTGMTLDASGNLLVGTTTNTGSARIYTQVNGNGHVVKQMSAGGYCFGANAFNNGGTYYLTYFEAAGTAVGSITSNGTGVTYGTLSDYRLKEAVQPLVGGLARVSALKPSIYKWKSNGSSGEGFIAHELAEVVPAAVTGEKDAVNEDGTVNPQGVDLSKIVPILVAAIQELTARVQTLETR